MALQKKVYSFDWARTIPFMCYCLAGKAVGVVARRHGGNVLPAWMLDGEGGGDGGVAAWGRCVAGVDAWQGGRRRCDAGVAAWRGWFVAWLLGVEGEGGGVAGVVA